MSLNQYSARTYNNNRNYEYHAKRVIQRHIGMQSGSGQFDNETLRAIYDWQGSPDRITTLKQDGKFGPSSLGCLIAEMKRGQVSTDLAHIHPYPHTLPAGSGPDASATVSSFVVSDLVKLSLNADGTGWQFRGRFRVDVQLNKKLANPARYQYRQYIKGTATSTPGRFTSLIRSKATWEATAAPQDQSSQFGVPGGGLSAIVWREDGAVDRKSVV